MLADEWKGARQWQYLGASCEWEILSILFLEGRSEAMTRKLTFVSRVSVGLLWPDDARWDWSTAENHVCEAPRTPHDPPMTLCGLAVVYNRITKNGTYGGFQWGNSRQVEAGMCAACALKLVERNLTLNDVSTEHTAIPDWEARKSWWPR